jgi:hypothetical protein
MKKKISSLKVNNFSIKDLNNSESDDISSSELKKIGCEWSAKVEVISKQLNEFEKDTNKQLIELKMNSNKHE